MHTYLIGFSGAEEHDHMYFTHVKEYTSNELDAVVRPLILELCKELEIVWPSMIIGGKPFVDAMFKLGFVEVGYEAAFVFNEFDRLT